MVPLSYNFRNLRVRCKTTVMTACGFTLTTAALVMMLAFLNGIEAACAASGEAENVLLLSKGHSDEVLSRIERSLVAQVATSKGVARDAAGQPLVSRELFLVIHHRPPKSGAFHFLQVRGVLPVAFQVHSQVRLLSGRGFRPGQSEVIIGKGLEREGHFQLGDILEIGRKRWKIVGIFAAQGAAFESELWCDLNELASPFRRDGWYSTVVLRAETPQKAEELAQQLRNSRNISIEAMTEPSYYQKQSEQTRLLHTAAWVVAGFVGLGALFGIMNTMFAAISQRSKDIAVLRLLGFGACAILLSFLVETLLIAALGSLFGAALGATVNGLTRSVALGARHIDFTLRVDASLLAYAAAFSLLMGTLGGLLPALSALRIKPLEALR